MSILSEIREAAENAARGGLGKLGFNVSRPDVPDDEDTYSPDILDLYKRSIGHDERGKEIGSVPVSMHGELRALALSLSHSDAVFEKMVGVWLSDRRSYLKDETVGQIVSYLDAERELYGMMRNAGFLCRIGREPADWVGGLCEIARHQGRACMNLLIQAGKQTDALDFEQWQSQMNERLSRFEVVIVRVNDDLIGLK